MKLGISLTGGSWLCLVWWSGVVVSTLASINEVNLCRAWLVLRWATVSGRVQFPVPDTYFGMQPTSHPRPTQPSIPMGSVNEYQLWLGRQRQV